MKQLLLLVSLFLVFSSSFSQNKWTYVTETYIYGSISGTIKQGFIFKTFGAGFYIVNEPTLQLVLALSPEVQIFRMGTDYKLIIEDFEEPVICKKLINVIESQIDGEFEGWKGETIFKMTTGQIWQQSSYAYLYHYAYSPQVIIYESSRGYVMKVEGVEDTINVVKLK